MVLFFKKELLSYLLSSRRMFMASPFDRPGHVDVGLGSPVALSSAPDDQPRFMLPGWEPGGQNFQTQREPSPWLSLDLGSKRAISQIRIFNNPMQEPWAPLQILCSDDGLAWRKLLVVHYRFGGKKDDQPLEMRFRQPMVFRHLKLESLGEGRIDIAYIEASLATPYLLQGRLDRIRIRPDRLTATYRHHLNLGYSWTFTGTLFAILIARQSGIHVDEIDFSGALFGFKDQPHQDIYPDLFEPAPEAIPALPRATVFYHHAVYATLRLADYTPYVDAYFRPSAQVRRRAAEWQHAYGMTPDNALVIVYRGTDKDSEVKLAPVDAYIDLARALLQRNPGLQIFVQTDQAQALDRMLQQLPGAIHIRELPVTSGRKVMHKLAVEQQFGVTKPELAKGLLAMTWLYASFRFVISHTGNIGLWLVLYRGHAEGFYQFDENAMPRNPAGAMI